LLVVAVAIDIHTHVVPIDFPAYCGQHGEARWPQMRAADCGHRSVTIDGKVFRTVSQECWDIDRRRAAMAAAGISRLPRLMFGWRHLDLGGRTARSPLEQARSVFYDTLVYDGPTLLHLVETFGVTQLCLGTDHPFAIQELEPVSRIDALDLTAHDKDLLLRSNARRFLGECC
jgi:hypothetical protein